MMQQVFDAFSKTPPVVDFDFTRAVADPRITFARAGSTATRVNASGFIEAVAADTPRFDFDPLTLSCRGLLIEASAINQISDSDFQTIASGGGIGFWYENSANLSVTTNFASDPANGSAAALLSILANTSSNGVFYRTGLTGTGAHTFSVYVKPNSTDLGVSLIVSGDLSTANFVRAAYTLSGNGTAGAAAIVGTATAPVPTTIRRMPDGWYRITITGSFVSATNIYFGVYPGTRTAQTTASQTLVWGAQFEAGLLATSLIPTASGAVTRNADVATITGADFSGFWQAGKGSALVRARPSTVAGIRPVLQFDDATADNIIALRGNAANPELYVRTGGVDQAQIDAGTIAANISYRLAGAWAENSCAASLNSGTPVLDGVATIPTVTQARLGSDGTNYLNGHIEAIEYYDERIPNSGLQVVPSAAGYQSIIGSVFRDAIIS